MKKKLLLLTTLIFVFLFSISASADVNEDDQNMVITGMASIDDNTIINKDVYIAPEATVFCDNVTINGDLYVWGSIQARESITVTGTANALSFTVFKPEIYSEHAPNYDDYEFGDLTSFGTADIAVLNISDNYLGTQIPEIEKPDIPSVPAPEPSTTPEPAPELTPEPTPEPTPDTVYVDALVVSEDTSYTDANFNENIYVKKGCTLTLSGNTICNGDIYVFGTLEAYGNLTVSGTVNCLHYGSWMSAGNYDYGYFNSHGSINITTLNVTDSFLNVLPSSEPAITPEPTVTPDVTPEATPTPAPSTTPEPTVTPEPTPMPTPAVTPTPMPTEEPTPTPEATPTPTPTPTATPMPTASPEATEPPVQTPTPLPTSEPIDTPTPAPMETAEPTEKPAQTEKPALTPGQTEEPARTPTPDSGSGQTPRPTETTIPAPILKLNAAGTIPMKVKTSFSDVKATEILSGDRIVKWESSNKKVVTVTQKGKLTAKKIGTATITCTTSKGATTSFRVKVQKGIVKLKKVTVNKKNITLSRTGNGKTFQIVSQKNPLTAPGKITFKSANKKVAAVNSKGKVIAKKKGKTKIYVICGKKKITINVTVK